MVSWSGSSLFYILTEEKLPLTRLNDSQGEAGISPQVTSITSGSWVEYLCSQAVMASRSHGGIFVTLQHNCTVDNRMNIFNYFAFWRKTPKLTDSTSRPGLRVISLHQTVSKALLSHSTTHQGWRRDPGRDSPGRLH